MKAPAPIAILGLMASKITMAGDLFVEIKDRPDESRDYFDNSRDPFLEKKDYSVGSSGTALLLYEISDKKAELVGGTLVWNPKTSQGWTFYPAVIMMDPNHTFVYVEYVFSGSIPFLAGFKITPHGLVYEWSTNELDAGDYYVNSLTAGRNYIISFSFPDTSDLNVQVFNQAGQHVMGDGFGIGAGPYNILAASISADGNFYYSCRHVPALSPNAIANAVAVYVLPPGALEGNAPQPIDPTLAYTSTDPLFVQSKCSQPVVRVAPPAVPQ